MKDVFMMLLYKHFVFVLKYKMFVEETKSPPIRRPSLHPLGDQVSTPIT